MTTNRGNPGFDFNILNELDQASKMLLGYFAHTWFRHYLEVISDNYIRLSEAGVIRGPFEPTDMGRYTMLFDFGALNLEKLAYINGIYYYTLAAHKNSNYRLMNRHPGKQVMYLRGYDFEGTVATGGGMAMGFAGVDTLRFTHKLGDLLRKHCQLFKVLSPKDLYWETADAQGYFYGDFEGLVTQSRYPMCSVFLNASRWKQDLIHLLDRMDHFVVYVSSITESVMWELGQLDKDGTRERVTVVFDEEAIKNKELQLGMRDSMRKRYGDHLIWAKQGATPDQTIEGFRKELARKFLVVDPDAFERDIEKHRERIAGSSAPLKPGERETWLEFYFHPAIDEDSLSRLHEFSAQAERHITESCDSGISCLPLFLNVVQMRIFMSLLLGDHDQAGRALVDYHAVMQGTLDYYSAPGEKVGDLSAEGRERHLDMLAQHIERSSHMAWAMLASGKSHQFEDFREYARGTIDERYKRTKSAVDAFFRVANER